MNPSLEQTYKGSNEKLDVNVARLHLLLLPTPLLHGHCRRSRGASDDACGYSRNHSVLRYALQHDRPRGYHGPIPDGYVSQDGCLRTNEHVPPDLWVPVPRSDARSPQSHPLQEGGVVPDLGRLAYHDARRVVQHDALADARARVDVHAEDLAAPALDHVRHHLVPRRPELVGDAVHLQGMVPLVVEQGFQVRLAGGVPVLGHLDVQQSALEKQLVALITRLDALAQDALAGAGLEDVQESGEELRRKEGRIANAVRENTRQGLLEGVVAQNGRVQVGAQQGLRLRLGLRLGANRGPNGIEGALEN